MKFLELINQFSQFFNITQHTKNSDYDEDEHDSDFDLQNHAEILVDISKYHVDLLADVPLEKRNDLLDSADDVLYFVQTS